MKKISTFLLAGLCALSSAWGQQSNTGLSFDGVNDYVNIKQAGNNVRTIEMWFKPSEDIDQTLSNYSTLIARENSIQNNNEFNISFMPSSFPEAGKIRFNITPSLNNIHSVYSENNTWEGNKWYHLAAIIDPTNGMRLFIDGKLQQSTNNHTTEIAVTDDSTTVGSWGDVTGRYFKGVVDDIHLSTEAIYTQNFTPSCPDKQAAPPVTGLWNFEGDDSFPATIHGATFVDANICPNSPISVNQDTTTIQTGQTVTYNVSANDVDIDNTIDLNSLMIIDSPKYGTTTISDNSGEITYVSNNSYFGTDSLIYQLCSTDGTCDTAYFIIDITKATNILSFDGIDDYMYAGKVTENIYTISMWFKPTEHITPNLSDYATLIARENSIQNNNEFNIAFMPSSSQEAGKIRFNITPSLNNIYSVYSENNTWEGNKWYHLAAIIDPTNGMKLFIDGKLQQNTNNYTTPPAITNDSITVGSWGNVAGRYFKGDIDNLGFYNTTLYTNDFTPICTNLSLTSGISVWNFDGPEPQLAQDLITNTYHPFDGAVKKFEDICKGVITTISKNESANTDNVIVYPNPSTGIFTFTTHQNTVISIYNSLGTIITQTSTHVVDLSTQPTGVYFYQIQTATGVQTGQLIKK